jgi:hypothetical protein
MIYFEGINSIIEGIYLGEIVSNKIASCNIFVNPINVSYLIGKTVVINDANYDIDKVDTLIRNNCAVIARIELPGLSKDLLHQIEFSPYIMRIDFDIMWNGKVVETLHEGISELIDNDLVEYVIEDHKLYFPKIYNLQEDIMKDKSNNLTGIGWALHQVGVNMLTDTEIKDLDILKSKKVDLGA